MSLEIGKQYLTRNGLTVTIINYEDDPRGSYPFIGQFENGPRLGDKDFWSQDGLFLLNNTDGNDLVSELN